MITAEYLPGKLNIKADHASRVFQDSSEWLLSPKIFRQVCQKLGHPSIDLFASRACHQLQRCMSWKPDTQCQAVDAFQQVWHNKGLTYTFPPFSLIGKGNKENKVIKGNNNLSNTTLVSSIVVQSDFRALCKKSNTLASKTGLACKPTGADSPTDRKQNISSSGMENFREGLLTEGISTRAADLIVKARRTDTRTNYESAWNKWVCWCSGRQVDPYECDLAFVLDYLASLFEQKYE